MDKRTGKKALTGDETYRLAAGERKKVQAEINESKVDIDRGVFVKTPLEREALKVAKRNYKAFKKSKQLI